MSKRGSVRVLAISTAFAVAFTSVVPTVGVAEDVPNYTTPQVGSQLPPDLFSPEVAQRTAQAMTQCFNITPELNQLKDRMENGGACMNTGDVDYDTEVSCEAFRGADGKFSTSKYDEKLKLLTSAKTNLSCKKGKFDRLSADLNCLKSQSSALEAQIASLQKDFQQNLQKMQQDIKQIQGSQEDAKTKFEDVARKLGVGEKGGSDPDGLMSLRDQTQKLLSDTLPQSIEEQKKAVTALEFKRKAHGEAIVARKMNLTQSCFATTPVSSYKCEQNGKSVSPQEYLLCRYEQNMQLTQSGQIQQSQVALNKAKGKAETLRGVLGAIFGDSAALPPMSQDPKGAAANANRSVKIFTVEDIDKLYGSQLRALDAQGIPVYDFVMKQVRNCYATSEKAVANELKFAAGLGQAVTELKVEESNTVNNANKLLETYSAHYGKIMTALTGQNLPLNTQACKSGAPSVQLNCLEDLKKNMEGIFHGNVPQSTIRMQIKGTIPAAVINLNCQGLSGCVTALKNATTGLEREVKRLEEFKKDYILRSNQSIENYAKRMSETFSGQSGMVAQKLAQMNQTLAQLGLPPIQTENVKGETLQADKNFEGLYGMPKDVMGVIGARMNPPMVDMMGKGFGSSLDKITKERQETDKEMAEVTKVLAKAQASKQSCMNADFKENIEALYIDAKNMSGCRSVAWCQDSVNKEGTGELQNLKKYVEEVMEDVSGSAKIKGGFYNVNTALSSGIGNCNSLVSKVEEMKRERDRLQGRLARLESTGASLEGDVLVVEELRAKANKYQEQIEEVENADQDSCEKVNDFDQKLREIGSAATERFGGDAGAAK